MKTITLDFDVYTTEIDDAFNKGQRAMIRFVNDMVDNEGKNVKVEGTLPEDMQAFIIKMKKVSSDLSFLKASQEPKE